LINLNRYALGVALVIVFSMTGCVTLPGSSQATSEPSRPTVVIAQTEPPALVEMTTAAPTPVPTITPSITPSPTITQTPTATPIPGWSIIHGSGVSLWLPDTWRGGNLENDLDQLLADSTDNGAIQQYAAVLEQNRLAINLWAYDTESVGNFHLTNVNIGHEPVSESVTVDLYIDAINRNLPENFTVTGRSLEQIHGNPGGRITIDVLLDGLLIKEVMYILKVEDVMWLVTFAAAFDTFDAQLGIIEQSVQTLEIGENRD